MICDNKSACHDPKVIDEENENAMRVHCTICKTVQIIRKDPIKQVPELRSYVKFFKRHALQGGDNLFYKYYPQYLRI